MSMLSSLSFTSAHVKELYSTLEDVHFYGADITVDHLQFEAPNHQFLISHVIDTQPLRLQQNNSLSREAEAKNQSDTSTESNFHITVTDTVSDRYHTHHLTNFDRIIFSDCAVAIDFEQGQNGGAIYRLYETAFDRTPDAAGYGYWLYQADHGMSLETIAQAFIESAEFESLHGSDISDHEFLNYTYSHGLDRAPDQEGYNFWLNQLDDSPRASDAAMQRPQYEEYSPLDTSMMRAKVLYGISESGESVNDLVHYVGLRPQYIEYSASFVPFTVYQ